MIAVFLVQRVLSAVPTLLLLSMISFAFISLAPGDAVSAMVDPTAATDPERLSAERARLGLDQPLPVRYVRWLGSVLQGDFGHSALARRPVREILFERLPATIRLGLVALVVAVTVGVSAGIVSALRQYSAVDHVVSLASYAAYSLPNFFIGLVAIYVFAVHLRWLPSSGAATPGAPPSVIDTARHLVLPVLALSVQFIGIYARQTRSAMLETLRADHVRTARAKGLREATVTLKHVLRNGLIPVVTIVGLNLPLLITGAIVTEVVFSWPGMGALTVSAIYGRDYPVIMGVVLVIGIVVIATNLLVDLLYAVVDPRVDYVGRA